MARFVLIDLDFNDASKIINLPDPSSDQDAATKAYVDSLIQGLAWKDDVVVSTQGNVDLSAPGSSIDGVTMSNNERFLARNQTDQTENGIYIFNGSATPATRASDADETDDLTNAVVTVNEGTDAGATFRQSTNEPSIGVDNIVWEAFGTAVPAASESTAGKIEIATQSETDTGTDDTRAITPDKLANWADAPKRHAQDIGDGSATSYTVTHNLGTKDVTVQVFRTSGNFDEVFVEVRRNSTNSVDILFDTAPASNAFRVVIVG